MSDMTSNTPMHHRSRRAPGWEYQAYFVPVFALSLPLAALRAGVAILTSDPAPRPGILTDAVRRARDVTTTICSI
ncbi:cytochrome PufQ [Jannaschia formosa]|uniref:cytochrome PufQ n=1 Tax=Jannaschia formosa TaxID=2259592 RepID=UPI00143169B5|nr:cytochrome PufQ [Jannaschia formosa]